MAEPVQYLQHVTYRVEASISWRIVNAVTGKEVTRKTVKFEDQIIPVGGGVDFKYELREFQPR